MEINKKSIIFSSFFLILCDSIVGVTISHTPPYSISLTVFPFIIYDILVTIATYFFCR